MFKIIVNYITLKIMFLSKNSANKIYEHIQLFFFMIC